MTFCKAMPWPGFEPGFPRPQCRVLTTIKITASYRSLLIGDIYAGKVTCTSWLNAWVVCQFNFTQLVRFNSFKKCPFSKTLEYLNCIFHTSSPLSPRLLLKTHWMRKPEIPPLWPSPPMGKKKGTAAIWTQDVLFTRPAKSQPPRVGDRCNFYSGYENRSILNQISLIHLTHISV